jgi:hypothetical protein
MTPASLGCQVADSICKPGFTAAELHEIEALAPFSPFSAAQGTF